MTRLQIGFGGKGSVKAWAKRERGIDLTDKQADAMWEQATQPGGPPIRHSALAHIEQMMELVETIHPSLSMRPWILVPVGDGALITSDTPVTLVARQEDGPSLSAGFMTAQMVLYPLTRKLGLMMGDPQMMIALGVTSERVRNGEFDIVQPEAAEMVEQLMNEHTARRASLYLFHHPDDGHAVPNDLPEPRPVTMQMSGGDFQFTGEPMLNAPHNSSGVPTD